MIQCLLCQRVGVIKAFRNMMNLEEHLTEHGRGQVMFACSKCGIVPVAVNGVLHSCERSERVRRRLRVAPHEDQDDDFDAVIGDGAGVHEDMCPKCGEALSGSNARQMTHISTCEGVRQNEVILNDGDLLLESEQELQALEGDEEADVMVRVLPNFHGHPPVQENGLLMAPFPPEWSNQGIVAQIPRVFNVHAHFDADVMLLNALRVSGQTVSDSTMTRLYAVLGSKEFQNSLKRGGLSKSFAAVKIREETLETPWMKVVLRHGQTKAHVRDLLDVLLEMNSDSALMEAMDFEGKWPPPDANGLVWGDRWTQFPVFQARLQEINNMGRKDLVDNMSWMIWADAGETARGRGRQASLALLCIVPLNVPPSMARRKDCLYPIAFFDSVGENAMIDVIEYFLPQLKALRDVPRLLSGRQRHIRVTLDGISGDNPAVTEICGTMMSAGSILPCKFCWLRQEQNENGVWQGLNDPSRWLAGACLLRTQKTAEKEIARMRLDATTDSNRVGFEMVSGAEMSRFLRILMQRCLNLTYSPV